MLEPSQADTEGDLLIDHLSLLSRTHNYRLLTLFDVRRKVGRGLDIAKDVLRLGFSTGYLWCSLDVLVAPTTKLFSMASSFKIIAAGDLRNKPLTLSSLLRNEI